MHSEYFQCFYGLFALLFVATPIFHLQWPSNLLLFFFYVGNLFVPFLDCKAQSDCSELRAPESASPSSKRNKHWSFVEPLRGRTVLPALADGDFLDTGPSKVDVLLRVGGCANAFAADHSGCGTFYRWPSLPTIVEHIHAMGHAPRGAWLALWLRGQALTTRTLRRVGLGTLLAGLIGLLAPLGFNAYAVTSGNTFVVTWGLTAIAIAAAGILLLSLEETSPFARILAWRPLAALGTISYGFYVFHALFQYLLLYEFKNHPRHGLLLFMGDLGASVVVAWISFRFYESPVLRFKNRWAPQEPKAHPHLPEPQPITS